MLAACRDHFFVETFMFELHISTIIKIYSNLRIKTFIFVMITSMLNRNDNKNVFPFFFVSKPFVACLIAETDELKTEEIPTRYDNNQDVPPNHVSLLIV